MQRIAHDTRSFDGFTLDLTRGCLLRGAQEIELARKPFEALKYLVENPGRLISNAELMQTLWPDTAVTPDSLVQCLGEVRIALSDKDNKQLIKNVPRRGYIFDRPVVSGPTALTTYTEEKGVQIIIEEEETNGHAIVATPVLPIPRTDVLISAHEGTPFQRLTTAIKQHRRAAAIGVLSLAVAAAGIVYFTRPSEAIDSVAVMPFVNASGDPSTEYLSDGISESIINSLSPNLKVIALNSVLRYKGKQTDPQAVGRELNVSSVLMGRLTQRGDDLTINVELVDVRDNRHLWGQQYNRKLADITAVPTEIAQALSEKLRLKLSGDETKRLTKRYTQSGEAYRLYMLGRYYFRLRRGKEGLEKSIDYFDQAIKKDPSYAPAYAGMGETYRLLGWTGWLPAKEARQKEELATLNALKIDDSLAEAHVLLAHIRETNLDWPGAEQEYKRALELDPNSVRAHNTYAWHLEMFARFDEARLHLKRAQELDPLELEVNMDIATLYSFLRQYDQAIEQFKKTIQMDPSYPGAHWRLAATYQEKGMYEESITELKTGIIAPAQLAYGYAVAGKKDESRKILDELKQEQSKGQYVSPFAFATIYMGLGDKDQAFEWFNKTFDENPYRLSFINVDPRFDKLRSDPRFTDLLRRMKLVS